MPRLGVVALGTLLATEALGFALVGVPQAPPGPDGKRSLRSASAQTGRRIHTHVLQDHRQRLGVRLGGRGGARRASSVSTTAFDDGGDEEVAPTTRCGYSLLLLADAEKICQRLHCLSLTRKHGAPGRFSGCTCRCFMKAAGFAAVVA